MPGGVEQVELGYARVGNAWVLATRTAVYSPESDLVSESNRVPLGPCAAGIRINALKRFRSLEMALKLAATDAIAAIDEASGELIAAPQP